MSTKNTIENLIQSLIDGVNDITGKQETNLTDSINALASGYGKSGSGGGSASLNIHYGDSEPSDTSMLWCKCNQPSNVFARGKVEFSKDSLKVLNTHRPTEYGTISATIGAKVYLFGGRSSINADALGTIGVFDTETETITTFSAMFPNYIRSMSVGVVGNKIYVFGGLVSGRLNTIYVVDTKLETITLLSTTLPFALNDIGVGVIGTKIYLFGGNDGTGRDEVYVFDTETETITELSCKLPYYATIGMGVGMVGDKVYLFGGKYRQSGYDNYSNSVYVFDPTTETIKYVGKMPRLNYYMGVGVVGTKVYLFGGHGGGSTYSYEVKTIDVFDVETATSSVLTTTLQNEEYGIGVGVVGNKIYLFSDDKAIRLFGFQMSLEENVLLLHTHLIDNVFEIVNGIEIGVENVFVGNSDGIAEEIKAYTYQNDSWTLI